MDGYPGYCRRNYLKQVFLAGAFPAEEAAVHSSTTIGSPLCESLCPRRSNLSTAGKSAKFPAARVKGYTNIRLGQTPHHASYCAPQRF